MGGGLVSAGCRRSGSPALGEGAAEGSGQREGGQGGVVCVKKRRVGRFPLWKAAFGGGRRDGSVSGSLAVSGKPALAVAHVQLSGEAAGQGLCCQ